MNITKTKKIKLLWEYICKNYYILYLCELEKYRFNECHGGS